MSASCFCRVKGTIFKEKIRKRTFQVHRSATKVESGLSSSIFTRLKVESGLSSLIVARMKVESGLSGPIVARMKVESGLSGFAGNPFMKFVILLRAEKQ